MTSIHLIEKLNKLQQVPGSQDEWESGFWAVTPQTAGRLVGGDLYLHARQLHPSHFGGVIQSFSIQPEGEDQGRVIFRFRSTPAHKGVKTSRKGWGNEKKIIF